MRSRALLVPRSRGESTRRTLIEAGLLRTDLTILREGGELAFPLRESGAVSREWGTETVRDFEPVTAASPSRYVDLLDWPATEKERLPRSFDVIGDVVLVRLPSELVSRGPAVGEALLAFVPGARIVGRDLGVHGPERRRRVERLAGTGSWRTRHRENGIVLEVDVERAYFSPRLAREHARVAVEVRPGERVYDLCCGVGPFAVTIGRDGRASHVTAVDANPEAIALLEASLAGQSYQGRVTPLAIPLESFVTTAEPVERVILNLPHEGIKYLTSVARTVAPRGRLYYYEIAPRDEFERRAKDVEHTLNPEGGWTVVERRRVHPYSPASDLVAFVIERAA